MAKKLTNRDGKKKKKKPFPPRATTSSRGSTHQETIEIALVRNHWFPSPSSGSGALQPRQASRARRKSAEAPTFTLAVRISPPVHALLLSARRPTAPVASACALRGSAVEWYVQGKVP